jgi:hypothetical protein
VEVGVGVVDDDEFAVFVGEVELAAGQFREHRRGVLDENVEGGGDEPAGELVGSK